MKKNKNDCVFRIDNQTALIQLTVDKPKTIDLVNRKGDEIKFDKKTAEMIAKRYLQCRENNKALTFYLSLETPTGDGHANMLIFNFKRNELEHYEPHGEEYLGGSSISANEKFNKNIRNSLEYFTKTINGYLPKKDKLKYVNSIKACPTDIQGFQSYETLQMSNKKFVHPLFSKGVDVPDSGYCMAYSLFYLDLRLKNLTVPSSELLLKVEDKIVKEDPAQLKMFVRGLTLELLEGMLEIIKQINIPRKFIKVVYQNLFTGGLSAKARNNKDVIEFTKKFESYVDSGDFYLNNT